MGPSTKKRKDPPPNCTLLDFFSGSDASKRARVRTSHQFAPSVRPETKVVSREIIVIDSDSGDDVHEKKNDLIRGPLLDPRKGGFEESGSPSFTHSEDKNAFGVPSALLRTPIPRVGPSSNELHAYYQPSMLPESNHSESAFYVSAPWSEHTPTRKQLSEDSQTNSAAYENMSSKIWDSSTNDPQIEFSIGEWAVEDDEIIALGVLGDGSGIHEVGGDLSDKRFCPVCGMDLTSIFVLEAQTHVNQCLDTAASQNDSAAVQKCPSISVPIKSDLVVDHGLNTLVKERGDLYSVLMNSHKEDEIWVEADAISDRDSRPTHGSRRKAPFYKVLQGMPIAVDAFCYGTIPGVTAYFLTHAHSDHYTNLGSKWKSGPIYCSEETANLIIHMLAVDPRWIYPLPLDAPTIVPNTGGVTVTLIEANHCPGSCLFFFEGQQTIDAGDSAFKSSFIGSSRIFRYLHCGDFRASPRHVLHPAVNGKHIDHIYLDTTYLDPKYIFSPQPLVISACAELARRLVVGGVADDSNSPTHQSFTIDAWMKSSTSVERGERQIQQERILVIVGAYSIGKERIVKAIAQALETKIYCDPRKTAILQCQDDKELHALLTDDPAEANVHILPLGTVTSDNLRSYLEKYKGTFSKVIGFRPTGWTYSPPSGSDLNGSIQSIISRGQSRHFAYTDLRPSQKSSYNIQIFGVPYSEHSSFFELTCFAMSCDWGKMIPTVNVGNSTSRAKMTKWLKRWESEKKCTKATIVRPRNPDYW